jgi:hypothetical protein
MEYRVEINPAKEKEFLQLLSAWESLDVVRNFSPLHAANDPDNDDELDRSPYFTNTAWEMAEPYKDLID